MKGLALEAAGIANGLSGIATSLLLRLVLEFGSSPLHFLSLSFSSSLSIFLVLFLFLFLPVLHSFHLNSPLHVWLSSVDDCLDILCRYV